MTRTFAAFFIAYYAVRIAVFVFRVMPGTLEKARAEYESKASMRGLPAVLLLTDSLLAPALILWRVGESYLAFNTASRYAQSLRAFFKGCELLRPRLRVLDAGCGTGTATFALLEALQQNHSPVESIYGFDLTPAMLARFQSPLASMKVAKVRLLEANVLDLDRLPPDWTHYDLVICAAMLDYVPRPELPKALAALRARLAPDGSLLAFVSRKTWVNRLLIERLWKANCYTSEQ